MLKLLKRFNMNLAQVEKDYIFTDSRIIAKQFSKAHNEVLKSIRKLITDLESIGEFSPMLFKEDFYKNSNNRKFPFYQINRDGFSYLAMGFTGIQALKFKVNFIEAFNLMEEKLLSQDFVKDENWKEVRTQSKIMRNQTTDVIKIFIEYATNQGSKSAKMYYMNITKMENKALGIIVQKDKKTRDLLDSLQLGQLLIVEDRVKEVLKIGMEKELFYKEIFQLAKKKVQELVDSFILKI